MMAERTCSQTAPDGSKSAQSGRYGAAWSGAAVTAWTAGGLAGTWLDEGISLGAAGNRKSSVTRIAAAAGTASTAPSTPAIEPPVSTAKIGTSGCRWTALPTTIGIMN